MDGYPAGSLDHNLPFLVVAGLTEAPVNALPFDNELKDQGVLLQSQLPSLETKEAKALREYIASQDAADQPWNPQLATKPYKFRVAFTGRVAQPIIYTSGLVLSPVLTLCSLLCCLLAEPVCPRTSKRPSSPQSYTRPFRR